jgi:formate C-acetyltransferase
MIEGRSDQELIRGINFLLCLELALSRGRSAVLGRKGPDTGDPRSFQTFEDLMAAWRAQLDHLLGQAIDHIGSGIENGNLEHSSHGRYRFNPLLSAITLDCLALEQDLIRGGARYRIWHVMGEAVSNAIDAAAALRKLVFEEQAVSMDEMVTAIKADWDGHENLRRRLMARAPKFANDDDYADKIGQEMMAYFLERTRHYAARYPATIFPPSVGTFSWYARIGKQLGATPDGRHAGEAVAANFSPAPGADTSGPTAAINSYLKMHVGELAAGAPLDLRFSSTGLRGEAGTQRLAGLISTFVDLGGNMLTVTVTDVEELRRAVERPEQYRSLRVRMGGWSAYFVMLGQEQQAIHISRVEHGLV